MLNTKFCFFVVIDTCHAYNYMIIPFTSMIVQTILLYPSGYSVHIGWLRFELVGQPLQFCANQAAPAGHGGTQLSLENPNRGNRTELTVGVSGPPLSPKPTTIGTQNASLVREILSWWHCIYRSRSNIYIYIYIYYPSLDPSINLYRTVQSRFVRDRQLQHARNDKLSE